MDRFKLSIEGDSLNESHGETEIYQLREEVKRKNATIEEKNKIIASLRQQLEDLQHDNEELENSEQLMTQKLDRLKKEIHEKDETIEAVSHALKEVEKANENFTKRYDARLEQITKIHADLTRTRKELEEVKSNAEALSNQNELLKVELEAAKKRTRREREHDLQDEVRPPPKKTSNHPPANNSEISKLKQELEVTETSWRLERQHKERYARENIQLDRKVHELTEELNSLKQQIENFHRPLPIQQENKPELTSAIHFSTADEVGEIMDESSSLAALHYCPNHRIKKSQFSSDYSEQKMRLERANELARRNMKTKPLHQTSYPLELDTFGPTNLTETDIKRGLVNGPRQALNDSSNQRRPVKKAEAFIV